MVFVETFGQKILNDGDERIYFKIYTRVGPVAEWYCASRTTTQVWGSNPGLGKVHSAFHSFSESIKRWPSMLGN